MKPSVVVWMALWMAWGLFLSTQAFPMATPTSPLLSTTSVTSPGTANIENPWYFVPSTDNPSVSSSWHQLVPRPWQNPRGHDVTVQFNPSTAAQAAQQLLLDTPLAHDTTSRQQIQHSMELFMDYCHHQQNLSTTTPFQARLVCGRGPTSAKCPQWHVDHVPVRYIQALVGPGCDLYAQQDPTIMETEDGGRQLLKVHPKHVQSVPTGQAVLLQGQKSVLAPACWHKSPSKVAPWQGRVLLTMDIARKE